MWAFLPARRDRRRTTVPVVIAAELDVPAGDVMESLLRMERGYHVTRARRGSWHRGVPLPPPPATTRDEDATLWD